MVRPGKSFLLPMVMVAGGCLGENSQTRVVAPDPFGNPAVVMPPKHVSMAPAPVPLAARVDLLGRRILAANPQAGVSPAFTTIGAPLPEIFHQGTSQVVVTAGLVQQCQTEGELAAVLCHELGKMVSEREALASPLVRQPDILPPINVPIGNDNAGPFGPPDATHLAELAKFERAHKRPASASLPSPDPQKLARIYLTKANFPVSELDQVAPLLQAAAGHCTFEKQMTNPTPVRPWAQ